MINVDTKLTQTEDGVWAEYNDSSLLIAHVSNLRFQRKLARLQQPHRSKIERHSLDPKIQSEILCKAMAGTVLLGWKDVVDANKQQVQFSEELAANVLINQPDIREFVSEFATDLDNFRDEAVKELGESHGTS